MKFPKLNRNLDDGYDFYCAQDADAWREALRKRLKNFETQLPDPRETWENLLRELLEEWLS